MEEVGSEVGGGGVSKEMHTIYIYIYFVFPNFNLFLLCESKNREHLNYF